MMMNIVLISLFIVGLVVTIISFIKRQDCIYGFGLGIIFSCVAVGITYRMEPNAMDVYQGKTTIQHTVVDGTKVDSCVVYKKNTNFITVEIE